MYVVGSIAAFILILGIIPPYPEIWKRRGRVVGISEDRQTVFLVMADVDLDFLFLAMDSLGADFSLCALGIYRISQVVYYLLNVRSCSGAF